jgi:hypothetical protein
MKPLPGPTWSVSPVQWGARVDYDQWTDLHVAKDAIAIHHGGSGDYAAANTPYTVEKEASQLRAWERYHLGKGWRGLAYGYAVGMTGNVYRIRGWNGYGAHRGDVDGDGISNNKEIVPVLFIMSGQPHRHHPSLKMLQGFEALRAYLEEEAETGLYLYGHRELMATACPGDNNMVYIRANRHSGAPPAPPPVHEPPPSEEDDVKELVEALQESLNTAGFTDYEDKPLVVDGVLGPRTKSSMGKRDAAAAFADQIRRL